MRTGSRRPVVFHGWYIVACGFLSQGMRVGLGAQTFGFFFKPMTAELGWSRTVMTGALLVRDLVRAVISPAFGFAVDRYGPRFLVAGSAIALGISLMLLSQTREIWHFALFYGVIGTFGIPGLAYGVISPTIAKWFIRHRGKATGIATAGLNVGSVAMTPLILFLINAYGWRTAWFCLAFVPWVVVAPAALWWLRRQPEDMGLLPDGAAAATQEGLEQGPEGASKPAPAPVDEASRTLRQAMVGRVLVSGRVRAAGRNGNRVADHPPYPVYDGPGVFRCAGGGFIHHLQRLRFSGQTGLGVSGRPVSGARDGGSGIDWQRRQHFRRRGGGQCLADAYHIRGNVWFHRRRSGGHQPPALGRSFRAAAPGRHTGGVERRFPDGQHWRANVRRPGL